MNPIEFKDAIDKCTDMIEVANVTNQLLDELATNFAISTISKKLTAYKKEFLGIEYDSKFLETIDTKNGIVTQHKVIKLLSLNSNQLDELSKSREKNQKVKAGFDDLGNVKNIEYPKISIAKILEIACQYCKSNDANKLAIGIMLATGLRGENICKSTILIDGFMITRDMDWYSNFQISFNSISKKRGSEKLNKYVIQTLIPADLVVSAYQKLSVSYDSKSILAGDDFTNSALRKSIARLINAELKNELKGIDDGHNLHICRGFYACVLNRILENLQINQMARKMIVQANLQHDNVAETEKYLSKFENSQFSDIPKNIEIETNINEIGEIGMVEPVIEPQIEPVIETQIEPEIKAEIEPVIEPEIEPENGLNLARIISKLKPELQLKFQEICFDNKGNLEESLIDLLNCALESKIPKIKSSDVISRMIDACHQYNLENENNPQKMIVPGYAFADKLYSRISSKQLARLTYLEILEKRDDVNEYLANHVENVKTHNSKYHRKDTNLIMDRIIELMK